MIFSSTRLIACISIDDIYFLKIIKILINSGKLLKNRHYSKDNCSIFDVNHYIKLKKQRQHKLFYLYLNQSI